jgi:N,N-dimethylformamidase beta subunit-like, C-terminal/BNR repeat-like domain
MRRKTKSFAIISVLLVVQLALNPSIISPFKFAHASEQNTIQSKSHVTAGTNNTVNLESSEISESTKQHTENSPNSSYANTTNLSMNQGHSEIPEIVTHGRYVYVLWLDDTNGNRDIYFKRSVDNGNTFDHTVNLSNNPGGSLNAHMAVSESTSSLYVVWEHIPGNNGEIFFTRSTDNGATFQSPITLGSNTGLNGSPQIVETENNNVYVVWRDATNGVLLTRSTDNGRTFGRPISVSDKNAYAFNPQIAISQGNVYVAWQSNPLDNNGSIVFSRSTDNGRTFESPISISKKEDIDKDHILSFNPRILAAPGTNDVYVVWHSGFTVRHGNYHVLLDTFFTRSTDNGATFERPISVSNYSVWPKSDDSGHKFESPVSLRYYSDWLLEPQMVISQGNVYVAWQSNPEGENGEIVFSRSTDNGRTFESPISISDKNVDALNPQIAISQGNVYVAWQSNPEGGNSEIVFSRSTDNGRTFESPISISDKNGEALNPQIVISKDSNLYYVWSDDTTGNEEIMLTKVIPKNIHLISSKYLHNNTGLQNNTAINMQLKNSKNIAFIERTFSVAAYNEAFYLFYSTNTNTTSNTTKYINLLSSKVIKKYPIYPEHEVIVNHIKWLRPQSNITLLTDEDAHNKSSLFTNNGTNKYDLILFGHNEYNTQEEYNNLRQFVANGGILIFLGANMFFAEVKYDQKSQTITLVKGHDWESNGKSAQPSVHERWANETTEWVGSIFCRCWEFDIIFGNNPFGYIHNEEQSITNPKAKIILDYNATENGANPKDLKTILDYNATENGANPKDLKIATYELNYKKGKVISLGLMTTNDLFNNVKFNRFFDSLLLYYVFGEKN